MAQPGATYAIIQGITHVQTPDAALGRSARRRAAAVVRAAPPGGAALAEVGRRRVALYVLSPIDLIPDVLPVIGFVDDLVLVPLAIRWLLQRLPPEIAQAAQRRRAG